GSYDQMIEKNFGDLRRAMAVPKGAEEVLKMPTVALRAVAEANPRSFPVQMALGHALRKEGQADEAMQVFERAAALVPIAGGEGSPLSEIAAIALEKKDRPRAIAALTSLVA